MIGAFLGATTLSSRWAASCRDRISGVAACNASQAAFSGRGLGRARPIRRAIFFWTQLIKRRFNHGDQLEATR
jgi:hypothetical protein